MASSINASTTAGLVNTADTSGVLQLQTAGTTAISIDASQAVSFTNAPTVTGGTANGVAYLNGSKVLTTGSALVFNGTNLILGDTTADGRLKVLETAAGAGVTFYNSANNSAGQIGTTNEAGAANSLEINAYRGSGRIVFKTNNTYAASFDASGNLLVGKTAVSDTTVGSQIKPNGVLTLTNSDSTNGTFGYQMYSTGAAAYRFYVGYGGTIFATSTVITAISDLRLKENVRNLETGLDAIMALKPRRFDWKEGKGQDKKDVAGFIAQEFEEVFPECVGTSKAGGDGVEYKSINHETLIPTLVKAIQEQQALITQLTARITALEGA